MARSLDGPRPRTAVVTVDFRACSFQVFHRSVSFAPAVVPPSCPTTVTATILRPSLRTVDAQPSRLYLRARSWAAGRWAICWSRTSARSLCYSIRGRTPPTPSPSMVRAAELGAGDICPLSKTRMCATVHGSEAISRPVMALLVVLPLVLSFPSCLLPRSASPPTHPPLAFVAEPADIVAEDLDRGDPRWSRLFNQFDASSGLVDSSGYALLWFGLVCCDSVAVMRRPRQSFPATHPPINLPYCRHLVTVAAEVVRALQSAPPAMGACVVGCEAGADGLAVFVRYGGLPGSPAGTHMGRGCTRNALQFFLSWIVLFMSLLAAFSVFNFT